MAVPRCRVELRNFNPHADPRSPGAMQEFRKMLIAFRRARQDAKIDHEYKIHEYYESPGEKKRRKQREAASARLKEKMRENFPDQRGERSRGEKSQKRGDANNG